MRILVTGSNSGIGYLTAKILARDRSRPTVILACRTKEKAIAAAESIAEPNVVPVHRSLQLESPNSVREFSELFNTNHTNTLDNKRYTPIDILVNNAGVFLSENPKNTVTINAVSTLLLTNLLAPRCRVVNVITSPRMQKDVGIGSPEKDIYGEYVATNGPHAAVRRYTYSKELLSCATAHRARTTATPIPHVLIGPGAVDTGIHFKMSDRVEHETRKFIEQQTSAFHGTPQWASDNVAAAALGAFDIRGDRRRVSVVDLGKPIHGEVPFQYADSEMNESAYRALLRASSLDGAGDEGAA